MKRNEGDCSNCPDRWFCKELCDPAKWYVNQDHVIMREVPSDIRPPRPLPTIDNHPDLTPVELKIVRCLVAGLTRSEVAEVLEINTQAVNQHVYRMKKKHVKNVMS
jgi:DNA-binding CsgD family transcriptional regulator